MSRVAPHFSVGGGLLYSRLGARATYNPGLNGLGFDVDEVELVSQGGEYRLRLQPRVVEPGHRCGHAEASTGTP